MLQPECFLPFIRVPPGPAGPLRNSHIPWISSRGSGHANVTPPHCATAYLKTSWRISQASDGDGKVDDNAYVYRADLLSTLATSGARGGLCRRHSEGPARIDLRRGEGLDHENRDSPSECQWAPGTERGSHATQQQPPPTWDQISGAVPSRRR